MKPKKKKRRLKDIDGKNINLEKLKANNSKIEVWKIFYEKSENKSSYKLKGDISGITMGMSMNLLNPENLGLEDELIYAADVRTNIENYVRFRAGKEFGIYAEASDKVKIIVFDELMKILETMRVQLNLLLKELKLDEEEFPKASKLEELNPDVSMIKEFRARIKFFKKAKDFDNLMDMLKQDIKQSVKLDLVSLFEIVILNEYYKVFKNYSDVLYEIGILKLSKKRREQYKLRKRKKKGMSANRLMLKSMKLSLEKLSTIVKNEDILVLLGDIELLLKYCSKKDFRKAIIKLKIFERYRKIMRS